MYNFRNEEEIKNEMLEEVQNTVDKSENSIIHDALSPAAIEFQNANVELDYVAGKIDIENLEGAELEKYIYQRVPIKRKLETKATAIVTIKGNENSLIEEGQLLSSGDNLYIIKETKRIDASGEIDVLVESDEPGSNGNTPAHTITLFPVAINGVKSATNKEAATGGYDNEAYSELLARYHERVRLPITSSNKYHYLSWAKEIVGVGDAKVVSLWQGDNTVKVIIIDSNKKAASENLIEEVQEYIDPGSRGLGEGQAPIGAFCTVVSARPVMLNIKFKIIKDESFSLEQIKTVIADETEAYLKTLAFKSNSVSYARIGSIILDAEGVIDYTDFTINEGMRNLRIEDEEIAMLQEVIMNESVN